MAYRGSNFRSPVSASLIHEIRMIAHTFFTQRTQQKIWGGKESQPLACLTCLQTRKKGKDAVTIQDGNAVCADHITAI